MRGQSPEQSSACNYSHSKFGLLLWLVGVNKISQSLSLGCGIKVKATTPAYWSTTVLHSHPCQHWFVRGICSEWGQHRHGSASMLDPESRGQCSPCLSKAWAIDRAGCDIRFRCWPLARLPVCPIAACDTSTILIRHITSTTPLYDASVVSPNGTQTHNTAADPPLTHGIRRVQLLSGSLRRSRPRQRPRVLLYDVVTNDNDRALASCWIYLASTKLPFLCF